MIKVNAAAPGVRNVQASAWDVHKSFDLLDKRLKKAGTDQAKREAQRSELTLEAAHMEVLAIRSGREGSYEGRRVASFIMKNERVITAAYEELPTMASLHFAEITALRQTWYMTAVQLHRAALQPSSKAKAFTILAALITGRTDYLTAYVETCRLINVSETVSEELTTPLICLLQQHADEVYEKVKLVLSNVEKLVLEPPSQVTREAFDLNIRLLAVVFRLCQHLEKVMRFYETYRRQTKVVTVGVEDVA